MKDLNKEREAFEADQNTNLLFERIEYIAALNAYMPKFEYADQLIVMQMAERFNFGWSMWQKAKAQAVPVWIATDFMKPDDHDYVDILINAERRIVDAVYLDGKFFIFPPFSKEQWTEVNNKVTHWMPRVDVASESGAKGWVN